MSDTYGNLVKVEKEKEQIYLQKMKEKEHKISKLQADIESLEIQGNEAIKHIQAQYVSQRKEISENFIREVDSKDLHKE